MSDGPPSPLGPLWVPVEQLRTLQEALLRADVERLELHSGLRDARRDLDAVRAEVERLEALFQQTHGVHHSWVDARHKVAQRQREACASMVEDADDGVPLQCLADAIRATPLVTEGEP